MLRKSSNPRSFKDFKPWLPKLAEGPPVSRESGRPIAEKGRHMSHPHGTSAHAAPGRAGVALLLLSLMGLLGGCSAIYDDTKGWANRLEASILEAAHELNREQDPAVDDSPPPSAGGKAEERTPATEQSAPAAMTPIPPVPPPGLAELRHSPAVEDLPQGADTGKQHVNSQMAQKAASDEDGAPKKSVPPLPKRKPQLAKAASKTAPAMAAAAAEPVDPVAMVLHLSSLRSEAAAKREWRTLKQDFPQALGRLEVEIRRTELGDKGTFYRVLAGPLPSRTEAQQACDAVKTRNVKQYCRAIPSRPADKAPS